jgi:hypothetical protein
MKISSYLLGMGAVASLVALNLTPANAQVGNGPSPILVVVVSLVAVSQPMPLRVKVR